MKYFTKYSVFLLVIVLLSSCISNTTEEDLYVQFEVFGLFPTANNQFTILASKTTEVANTAGTNDSLLFIKIDAEGKMINKNARPTVERPSIYSSQLLDNGNILLYGSLVNLYYGENSAFEFTLDGQLNWELYLGSKIDGIIPADNNYLFVFGWERGERIDGVRNNDDLIYSKISTNGDTSWTKSFLKNMNITNLSTGILTNDNGCIAAGKKFIPDGGVDIWIMRFNAQGDTLWSKTYGGDFYDDARSVNILSDNSLLVVGSIFLKDTSNTDRTMNSGTQSYLLKLDANGDKIWSKAVGRTLRDDATSFIEGSDGSLIICGITETSYEYLFDVPIGWVSKLDPNGNTIWRSEFDNLMPRDLIELDNGDILAVSNNYDETNYKSSIDVLKLSSDGTLLSSTALTP